MIKWKVYTWFGSEFPIGMTKEIPEGVRPPKYVNAINNNGFLPYVGEFEQVRINEDEHTVWYERINPMFGG